MFGFVSVSVCERKQENCAYLCETIIFLKSMS